MSDSKLSPPRRGRLSTTDSLALLVPALTFEAPAPKVSPAADAAWVMPRLVVRPTLAAPAPTLSVAADAPSEMSSKVGLAGCRAFESTQAVLLGRSLRPALAFVD